MIEYGIYRHYKGKMYFVIGVAKHSETLEDLVVYQNKYGEDIWVRPLSMFLDKVEVDGQVVNRFTKLSNKEIDQIAREEIND